MAPMVDSESARCIELARFWHVLGEPTRLRILRMLVAGERCVGELSTAVGKRQQSVSHHLTILKLRRVVVYDRRAKRNVYRLTPRGPLAVETLAALRLA